MQQRGATNLRRAIQALVTAASPRVNEVNE